MGAFIVVSEQLSMPPPISKALEMHIELQYAATDFQGAGDAHRATNMRKHLIVVSLGRKTMRGYKAMISEICSASHGF